MNDRFDFVVINIFVVLQVTTTVQLQVTTTVVNLVQLESLLSQSAPRENLFSKFPKTSHHFLLDFDWPEEKNSKIKRSKLFKIKLRVFLN